MSVRGIESVATLADHLRSAFLRTTMSWPGMRQVFISRPLRLAVLFSVSFVLTLGLSLFFPLWVLAIGPAIYGVPHLVSSLRYFDYEVGQGQRSRGNIYRALAAVTLMVLGYRLIASAGYFGLPNNALSEWKGSTYLELAALGLTFVAGAWLYKKTLREIALGLVFLAPLLGGFVLEPGWTIGFLVLAHNFVAFAYWIRSAKSRSEKRVAWAAGCAVFAVTCAIFFGGFDRLLGWIAPLEELSFAQLRFEDLAYLIAPWSDSPRVGMHAAIAYAFGQAMHYFVWLKAIPDQHHHSQVPTSFRQSLSLLEKDFGGKWTALIAVATVALACTWIFMEFSQARVLYFAMAAYHGYLEIAGLALSRSRG